MPTRAAPAAEPATVSTHRSASPEAAPVAADALVRATRAWALGALLGLVALGVAWELWLAPTGSGTLALKVVPLLPALPGLMRHRMATHRWLSLLVWLYVLEGLVRATSESGLSQGLAVLEAVLALVLFGANAVHIRWRLRQARSAA
ncbi:MAG: hypothetical protein RI988_3399 [Pseudomonadota bacterium]|jgi:uncharacterized membrane protein